MKRKIIQIDEEKCTGCGLCTQGCPEGAIKIISGKARLVGDLYCDGLGACIGTCPENAITVIEREAEPYDERTVMANIIKQGEEVICAHLEHLREHNQRGYLQQALDFLKEEGMKNPMKEKFEHSRDESFAGGCPGARMMDFTANKDSGQSSSGEIQSQLKQWPVQLHLISPAAPYYQKADVILAADCVAYALGGFHNDYLKGKAIAIACPKLDEGQDVYVEKIKAWFEEAKINTLTVMIMQVPCCMGLLKLAQRALQESKRKVPLKYVVVSVQGEVLQEEWA